MFGRLDVFAVVAELLGAEALRAVAAVVLGEIERLIGAMDELFDALARLVLRDADGYGHSKTVGKFVEIDFTQRLVLEEHEGFAAVATEEIRAARNAVDDCGERLGRASP